MDKRGASFTPGDGRVPAPNVETPREWDTSFDSDGEGAPARSSKKLNKQQLEFIAHIKQHYK